MGFILHNRIILEVKRVEYVSERLSYILLTVHWYKVIPKTYASGEDKTDYTNNTFSEELECIFNNLHKYHLKILFGDFKGQSWQMYYFQTNN
jgi:hypothetical protein